MRFTKSTPTQSALLCILLAVSLLGNVAMAASTTDTAVATTDTSTASTATDATSTSTDSATETSTSSSTESTSSASTTDSSSSTTISAATASYSYPAPSVPPTSNAPYMQASKYPDGFVFIIVGSILAFLGLCILAWRGFLAWLLHRSVRKSAQNYAPDRKSLYMTPNKPSPGAYKQSPPNYRDSTMSLSMADMDRSGRGSGGDRRKSRRKSSRPAAPAAVSAATASEARASLFFSPTAGTGLAPNTNAGQRSSTYLPAGYYAAGVAQPGGIPPAGSESHMGLGDQASGGPRGMGYPDSSAADLGAGLGHGQFRPPSMALNDMFDDSAVTRSGWSGRQGYSGGGYDRQHGRP